MCVTGGHMCFLPMCLSVILQECVTPSTVPGASRSSSTWVCSTTSRSGWRRRASPTSLTVRQYTPAVRCLSAGCVSQLLSVSHHFMFSQYHPSVFASPFPSSLPQQFLRTTCSTCGELQPVANLCCVRIKHCIVPE